MSDEELVTSRIAAEPHFHVAAGDALTRRGLEDAWHAGQVLLAARQRLGDRWLGWLDSCTDIPVSRAEALMRLAENVPRRGGGSGPGAGHQRVVHDHPRLMTTAVVDGEGHDEQ